MLLIHGHNGYVIQQRVAQETICCNGLLDSLAGFQDYSVSNLCRVGFFRATQKPSVPLTVYQYMPVGAILTVRLVHPFELSFEKYNRQQCNLKFRDDVPYLVEEQLRVKPDNPSLARI